MNKSVLKFFRSIQVHFPFLQDLKFSTQRRLRTILDHTHEKEFELIKMFSNPSNNVFVDIGANRGDAIHSILMREPDASVVAFEPNGLLASKLNRLYGKDHRVRIHNCGLGDSSNSFELYVPFYNNYMFDGLASFKEKNARDWLKGRIYGYTENLLRIQKMRCEVKKLDDFNLRPCFIKIDVQGFEYEVLLGAMQTIKTARPVILMESPAHKELDLLYSLEYQPFVLKNQRLLPGTKNYNVFFIPEESIIPLEQRFHIISDNRQAA